MAATYSPPDALKTAEHEVGYHEVNGRNKFSPWQGLNSINPWCASFSCYCVWMAGYRFPANSQFRDKGEASCSGLKARAQQEGLWRDRWWSAKPGDQMIFDWDGRGALDHVEVVKFDAGEFVYTVGGNTSDSVAYRKRDRRYCVGFYAHSQSSQVKPVIDAATLVFIKKAAAWLKRVEANPLKQGDHSNDVTFLNQLLAARGLLADTSRMNTYTEDTRDAVVHYKRLHPELGNIIGHTVGVDFARSILAPR